MNTLWLVRHAEAEKAPGQSADDLFSVAPDPPLSARGVRQAERARDALAGAAARVIVASPARRAQETAHILAAPHALPVETDARLAELAVGGSNYEETLAKILGMPERLRADPEAWGAPRAAFAAAIDEIARRGPAIVVAHGLSNRAFLCAAAKIPLDELLTIPQEHASVTRLDHDGARWSR